MLKQHRELVARKGGSNKPHGNKHRPQRAGTATDVVKDDTTAGQGIIASIKLTNSVYPATAGLISHKVLWRLLTGSDDKTAVPTQEQFLHARTVSQYNCTWSGFTTWCETNQLMFPLVPSVLVGYCAFKRAAGEASSSLKDVASRIDGRIMIVRESDPDSKFVAGSDRSWDQGRNRCAQLQRAVNVTFTPKKAIALDYEDISKCTQRSQHIISFATNGRLRCGGLTNICQSDIPAPHDAWPKIMVHSSRCSVYEGEADHRWLPHNIVNNVYKMLPITPEFLTDTVLYELNKSYHARNGLIYVESKPRYTGHSFSRTFAVYVRQFLNKNNLPHSKTNITKSVLGRINELAGWTTGSKEFFDYSLDFMDFMSKRNPLDLRVLNYICWGSY